MKWKDDKIILDKVINNLDKLVIDFVKILEKFTDYVLVSGYVAILFGRSRGTEDVDLIIYKISKNETGKLLEELKNKGYWCINTDNPYELLSEDLAVRFAEEGEVIPNFEVKFSLDEYESISLKERIEVRIGEKSLYIGPLELQIAYKIFLGGQKDLEDALHLYEIFKEKLNIKKLEAYCNEMQVSLDEIREP